MCEGDGEEEEEGKEGEEGVEGEGIRRQTRIQRGFQSPMFRRCSRGRFSLSWHRLSRLGGH